MGGEVIQYIFRVELLLFLYSEVPVVNKGHMASTKVVFLDNIKMYMTADCCLLRLNN